MSEENNVAAATLLIQKFLASLNKNICLHVATSRSFTRGVRPEARTSVSLVQGMWRNMQFSFDLNMTQWVALLLDIYIEVEITSHTKEFSTAPCRAPILQKCGLFTLSSASGPPVHFHGRVKRN